MINLIPLNTGEILYLFSVPASFYRSLKDDIVFDYLNGRLVNEFINLGSYCVQHLKYGIVSIKQPKFLEKKIIR